MIKKLAILLLPAVLLSACGNDPATPPPTKPVVSSPTPGPTEPPPTENIQTTSTAIPAEEMGIERLSPSKIRIPELDFTIELTGKLTQSMLEFTVEKTRPADLLNTFPDNNTQSFVREIKLSAFSMPLELELNGWGGGGGDDGSGIIHSSSFESYLVKTPLTPGQKVQMTVLVIFSAFSPVKGEVPLTIELFVEPTPVPLEASFLSAKGRSKSMIIKPMKKPDFGRTLASILACSFLVLVIQGCSQAAEPATTATPTATRIRPTATRFQPTATRTIRTTNTPESTPTPIAPHFEITTIHMVDDQMGWAVFDSPEREYLAYSTDGGKNWMNITPPNYVDDGVQRLMLTVLDARSAWAYPYCTDCGEARNAPPMIFHTTNAGRSWQISSINMPNHFAESLQSNNSQNAWLTLIYEDKWNLTRIQYRTRNGGITWNLLASDDPQYFFGNESIFFNDNEGLGWWNQIVIFTSDTDIDNPSHSWIHKTRNGGNSWQSIPAPLPPLDLAESQWGKESLAKDCWSYTRTLLGQGTGILGFRVEYKPCPAIGRLSSYHFSTDHGDSWISLWRSGETFFLNDQVGWRLTGPDTGVLEKTTDGGQTWFSQQETWRIAQRDGISYILHINDGEVTTIEIRPKFQVESLWPGQELRLVSLSMENAKTGNALESGGAQVCTVDGGLSWSVCDPPAEVTLPTSADPLEIRGELTLDGTFPKELLSVFPNEIVPFRLLDALNEGNRKYAEKLEKTISPFRTDLSESKLEEIKEHIMNDSYQSDFECTSQRADPMANGLAGTARMCTITYPGKFTPGGAGNILDGGYFVTFNWFYYYYEFVDGKKSQLWPGVTAADFINPQVGWRQIDLDRENEFYEIQKTQDGGLTWHPVTTVSWLAELDFVSEQEGWAIAWQARQQGIAVLSDNYRQVVLLHTTDGGRTWQELHPVVGP